MAAATPIKATKSRSTATAANARRTFFISLLKRPVTDAVKNIVCEEKWPPRAVPYIVAQVIDTMVLLPDDEICKAAFNENFSGIIRKYIKAVQRMKSPAGMQSSADSRRIAATIAECTGGPESDISDFL